MFKRYTILLLGLLFVLSFSTAFATKNVTFSVHMGIQMQLKAFTPATDTLVMRGDWEHFLGQSDWAGVSFRLLKSATNDSIYTITIPFPDSVATKAIKYKYVVVNKGENWESSADRPYTVTADASQSIPIVYFNDRKTLGVTHFVTFQLDMTALKAAGFNDATDSIEVRGGANELTNWGSGVRLTKSLLNPNTYQVKLSITSVVGTVIDYKYHADPEVKFDNTGWETSPNRQLTIVDNDVVIAAIAPAITVKNVISKDVTLTLNVDMTNARERFHNALITGVTGVYVGGGATPMQWPGSWIFSDTASTGGTLIKLTKGTGNTWSTTMTFKAANNISRNIEYKYSAVFPKVDTLNGGTSFLDNEAGFAANHKVTLNDAAGTQTVNDRFGGQIVSVEQDLSAGIPGSFELSQNYPNPFNPSTTIRYAVPKSGFVTLKVYNMLGQVVATLFEGEQNAGAFSVQYDASRLTSGVYFYRLSSGNFSETKKLMLLK